MREGENKKGGKGEKEKWRWRTLRRRGNKMGLCSVVPALRCDGGDGPLCSLGGRRK